MKPSINKIYSNWISIGLEDDNCYIVAGSIEADLTTYDKFLFFWDKLLKQVRNNYKVDEGTPTEIEYIEKLCRCRLSDYEYYINISDCLFYITKNNGMRQNRKKTSSSIQLGYNYNTGVSNYASLEEAKGALVEWIEKLHGRRGAPRRIERHNI